MLLDDATLVRLLAATRELEDIDEDFEGPPLESQLPCENRLPLNTNFYRAWKPGS